MRIDHGQWKALRVTLIALAVIGSCAMCGTVSIVVQKYLPCLDVTECTFSVTLLNDSNQSVVVKQCDTHCTTFHEIHRLDPGERVPVNTSSENVDNYWIITNGAGQTLGCLDLLYDHEEQGLVVPVSRMAVCP